MSAQDSHGGAAQEGDLRVWWIPQMPMEAFYVPVESLAQAKWLLSVLADYDAFQFENCIKPDYCNAGGLQVREDGSWLEWMDPETGDDIDSWDPAARPIDTAELERLADECREMGNAAHQQPGASKYMRTLWKAEKALREVLAHRKAEAWQPIETAPKDGSDLLVWYDHDADPYHDPVNPKQLTDYAAWADGGDFLDGRGVCIAKWLPMHWVSIGEYGEGYWLPAAFFAPENSEYERVVNAIYWRPLPAPPTTPEVEGGCDERA